MKIIVENKEEDLWARSFKLVAKFPIEIIKEIENKRELSENEKAILNSLTEPLRSVQIAKRINMPEGTCSGILARLAKLGYVKKFRAHNGKRGAPRVFWKRIN